MSTQVMLHGTLATHRRGWVMQEALAASATAGLPVERAVVAMFGQDFQAANADEQTRLIEWTRTAGHVLLLLPPFAATQCERPVPWRAERLDASQRGGEGIGRVLAGEVTYRLSGHLQTPALAGATWSDLSVGIGTYRAHPAAGLFVVTCLPLWSLAVLDAPRELASWLAALVDLAGTAPARVPEQRDEPGPDHYGLLVFLLSKCFSDENNALAGLAESPIFRFPLERARSLLKDLQQRGLIVGAAPTLEAEAMVMQSPYAAYVTAVREVSK